MKSLWLTLIFLLIISYRSTEICYAEDDLAKEFLDINSSPLKNQGAYTEIVKNIIESGEKGESKGLSFKGFMNIFSFYKGRDNDPSATDYNMSFWKEFSENLIINLNRDIVFVSFLEAEAIFNGSDSFPYGQQIWFGFADTMTRRYTLARWADAIAQKVQTVTSISYTSSKSGVKLRLGPYFGEPPGVYVSAKKAHLRLMCLGNGDVTRVGLEWIFDQVDIGNKLGYIEISDDGKSIGVLVLYKERF